MIVGRPLWLPIWWTPGKFALHLRGFFGFLQIEIQPPPVLGDGTAGDSGRNHGTQHVHATVHAHQTVATLPIDGDLDRVTETRRLCG